jgi:hypothetical protein
MGPATGFLVVWTLASVPEYDPDVILKADVCNETVKAPERFQTDR